jgi:hypothetical protein
MIESVIFSEGDERVLKSRKSQRKIVTGGRQVGTALDILT